MAPKGIDMQKVVKGPIPGKIVLANTISVIQEYWGKANSKGIFYVHSHSATPSGGYEVIYSGSYQLSTVKSTCIWDNSGRVVEISATNGKTRLTFEYDEKNRLKTSRDFSLDNGELLQTTQYRYMKDTLPGKEDYAYNVWITDKNEAIQVITWEQVKSTLISRQKY